MCFNIVSDMKPTQRIAYRVGAPGRSPLSIRSMCGMPYGSRAVVSLDTSWEKLHAGYTYHIGCTYTIEPKITQVNGAACEGFYVFLEEESAREETQSRIALNGEAFRCAKVLVHPKDLLHAGIKGIASRSRRMATYRRFKILEYI